MRTSRTATKGELERENPCSFKRHQTLLLFPGLWSSLQPRTWRQPSRNSTTLSLMDAEFVSLKTSAAMVEAAVVEDLVHRQAAAVPAHVAALGNLLARFKICYLELILTYRSRSRRSSRSRSKSRGGSHSKSPVEKKSRSRSRYSEKSRSRSRDSNRSGSKASNRNRDRSASVASDKSKGKSRSRWVFLKRIRD